MLDFDAETLKGIAGSVDVFKNILIGERLILVVDGNLAPATTGDVLVHEGCGGIVDISKLEINS